MKNIIKTIALSLSIGIISGLSPMSGEIGILINQQAKAGTIIQEGVMVTGKVTINKVIYALLSNGEAQVYDASKAVGNVVIPSEVSGYSVTSIGNYAFVNYTGALKSNSDGTVNGYASSTRNTLVTSIVIPESVRVIGTGAFFACFNLISAELPNSIEYIADSMFAYCNKLTSIKIPDSVTRIDRASFLYCTALESIKIPKSVETIGENAFRYCDQITYVEIPESVKELGENAFETCLVVKASKELVDKQKSSLKVYLYNTNGKDILASYYVVPNTDMSTYIDEIGADWEKVSGSDISDITEDTVYKLVGQTLESPTLIPSSTQVKNRQDGITIKLN